MVDRENTVQVLNLLKEMIDVGNVGACKAKVDELRCAKDIGVALKGRDLASWKEQQIVEVGLQLADGIELRDRIVIADGDEIETSSRGGLHGFVQRARDFFAG